MSRDRYLVFAESVRLERHSGAGHGAEGAMLVPNGRVHLASPGSATTLCGASIRGLVVFPGQSSYGPPAASCDGCRTALGPVAQSG